MERREIGYALGPLIQGRRAQPVLRITMTPDSIFVVEARQMGQWQTVATSKGLNEAYQMMHKANAEVLSRDRLRIW